MTYNCICVRVCLFGLLLRPPFRGRSAAPPSPASTGCVVVFRRGLTGRNKKAPPLQTSAARLDYTKLAPMLVFDPPLPSRMRPLYKPEPRPVNNIKGLPNPERDAARLLVTTSALTGRV